MLTILNFVKKHLKAVKNQKGATLIMVITAMSAVVVLAASISFVAFSSYTRSVSDTNSQKAYETAVSVADSIKGSMSDILEPYQNLYAKYISDAFKYFTNLNIDASKEQIIEKVNANEVLLEFESDDAGVVNYTILDGVKVQVQLQAASYDILNETKYCDKMLITVFATYNNATRQLSFYANNERVDTEEFRQTLGNAFVLTKHMDAVDASGNPAQGEGSPNFKQIKGDISINASAYAESGTLAEKALVFNPKLVNGLTGSIFCEGNLIIGSPTNIIQVQGNIYVQGNLYVRGLELGVQLDQTLPVGGNIYVSGDVIFDRTYTSESAVTKINGDIFAAGRVIIDPKINVSGTWTSISVTNGSTATGNGDFLTTLDHYSKFDSQEITINFNAFVFRHIFWKSGSTHYYTDFNRPVSAVSSDHAIFDGKEVQFIYGTNSWYYKDIYGYSASTGGTKDTNYQGVYTALSNRISGSVTEQKKMVVQDINNLYAEYTNKQIKFNMEDSVLKNNFNAIISGNMYINAGKSITVAEINLTPVSSSLYGSDYNYGLYSNYTDGIQSEKIYVNGDVMFNRFATSQDNLNNLTFKDPLTGTTETSAQSTIYATNAPYLSVVSSEWNISDFLTETDKSVYRPNSLDGCTVIYKPVFYIVDVVTKSEKDSNTNISWDYWAKFYGNYTGGAKYKDIPQGGKTVEERWALRDKYGPIDFKDADYKIPSGDAGSQYAYFDDERESKFNFKTAIDNKDNKITLSDMSTVVNITTDDGIIIPESGYGVLLSNKDGIGVKAQSSVLSNNLSKLADYNNSQGNGFAIKPFYSDTEVKNTMYLKDTLSLAYSIVSTSQTTLQDIFEHILSSSFSVVKMQDINLSSVDEAVKTFPASSTITSYTEYKNSSTPMVFKNGENVILSRAYKDTDTFGDDVRGGDDDRHVYIIDRDLYFNFEGKEAEIKNYSGTGFLSSARTTFIVQTGTVEAPKNISIYINATDFKLRRTTFQVEGAGNCYIYLVGDTTISLSAPTGAISLSTSVHVQYGSHLKSDETLTFVKIKKGEEGSVDAKDRYKIDESGQHSSYIADATGDYYKVADNEYALVSGVKNKLYSYKIVEKSITVNGKTVNYSSYDYVDVSTIATPTVTGNYTKGTETIIVTDDDGIEYSVTVDSYTEVAAGEGQYAIVYEKNTNGSFLLSGTVVSAKDGYVVQSPGNVTALERYRLENFVQDDQGDYKAVKNGIIMVIGGNSTNQINVNRGGLINGVVYIPEGTYNSETYNIFGTSWLASISAASKASIIAKNIEIGGQNEGNLIFEAYDVGASGLGGAKMQYDETADGEKGSEWSFGGYLDS